MSARIRQLALYTANQDGMATFYKTVFGMKRITESFNNPDHGHISDCVIGMAVLNRRSGFAAALDHFGHAVESIENVKRDLNEIAGAQPGSAPKELAGGIFGHITQKDIDGCKIGEHAIADPAGLLVDLSVRAG